MTDISKRGYKTVTAWTVRSCIGERQPHCERSESVVAEVKRLVPGRPIKQLVNTHSHFDHLGGVRAYVAEGATIGDKLTLSDGEHEVELHYLKNFGHHDGTRVACLPEEKILVEADAFNPPAAPLTQTPAVINPNNQSLVANIERLKLDVQRIVPIHLPADNRKITLAELLTAVGKN